MLKQFGINIGAVINSGNFSTALLTRERACRSRLRRASARCRSPASGRRHRIAARPTAQRPACSATTMRAGGRSATRASTQLFDAGNTQLSSALRALERDGLVRTLAEPNLTAVSGETAKFLAGGEFPIPVVDSDGKLVRHLQGVRRRSRLHAGRPVGRPHQPAHRDRGERAHQRRRRRPVQHQHPGAQEALRPSRRSKCRRADRWRSPA